MDFQVLGPLRARDGDAEVDLGGPKQRLVLAILLAARGSSVSTDALIEGVWNGSAPATARKTLQGYVHHLRSRIDGDLQTDKAGYSLTVGDDTVDERRFGAAVTRARAIVSSEPREASDRLADALALWKGTPYADLDGSPVLLPEITRLNETRLVALGDRIDADLELGRHDLLIGELESLTVDHPFHERFRSQHMLALYRSGRHAEALRAFSATRRQLIEDLGIEPSSALQQLEHQILERDPELDLQRKPHLDVDATPSSVRAVRGYELREELRRTARGALYRGYQRSVGREVAVEVIGAELADEPTFVDRFVSDAGRVAGIDNPHIVYVHDAWREPGRAFQVMRWIESERLDEHLKATRLDDPMAVRVLDHVADALVAAHRAGVVHGDVSARSVLLSSSGDAYLTDFVVGRSTGSADDDRRAFVHLALHALLGVEPAPDSDLCALLHSAVTSTALSAALGAAVADPAATDPTDLVRSLRRALGVDVTPLADQPGSSSPPDRLDLRCPYKGLQAFQAGDAEDFFGRDEVVDRLHKMVLRRRLVAVVGPSGSGKSSLVRAGLVPRLREGERRFLIADMFPGPHPFDALARSLESVAVSGRPVHEDLLADRRGLVRVLDAVLPDDTSELVLVVDQFEEVFSTVVPESLRTLFLDSLEEAVTDAGGRLRVVLTLRADFFDRPLGYADFGRLVEEGLVPLAMPDDADLTRAIERPAAAVGLRVQPGLAAAMLRDVAGEPGGLPLLQYALTELFERRSADELTVEDYRLSGGVLGSVAARAELLYAELDTPSQWAMRQAFLRMVAVDGSTQRVRRRVTRTELRTLEVDGAALDDGLRRFGAHRLLTFDSDPVSRAPTVEVAHEALLSEWERLRRWIDDRRHQLEVRHRLEAAIHEWEEAGEDSAYLLVGRRLVQFDEWAAETDLALDIRERAFLEASRQHDEAQARRTATRRRRTGVVLVVFAALAAAFGVVAVVQRNSASDEAYASETSRLASQAGFEVERDRQSALLMAAEAYRRDPGFEGLNALQRALVAAGPYLGNLGAGRAYGDVHFVGSDLLIASTGDEVHLIDPTTGSTTVLPVELGPSEARVPATASILASSPSGLVAVAGAHGEILLVDTSVPSVKPFPRANKDSAVALSPDGGRAAIADRDGLIEIVDLATGEIEAKTRAHVKRLVDAVTLPPGAIIDASLVSVEFDDVEVPAEAQRHDRLVFSEDGERLLTAAGPFFRAWETDGLRPLGPEILHLQGEDEFNLVATAPDSLWLDGTSVVAADDSYLVRWNIEDGEQLGTFQLDHAVVDAARGSNGDVLLLTDTGDVTKGPESRSPFDFDVQERSTSAVAVSGDHTRLAVATNDGIVLAALDGDRLLARAVRVGTPSTPSLSADGSVLAPGLASDGLFDVSAETPTALQFRPDHELADFGAAATYRLVRSGDRDVVLWSSEFANIRDAYDIGTSEYLGDFWGRFDPAWSPHGDRVARADRSGDTTVVDSVSDTVLFATSRTMQSGHFDSTGDRIVLVFDDGSATVVDLGDGSEFALPAIPGGVVAAAFEPSDTAVVAIGREGAVWLVDPVSGAVLREMDETGATDGTVEPPVFIGDGALFVAAPDDRARLWHLDSGRLVGTPFPSDPGTKPHSIAGDGHTQLVTPFRGDSLIWNLDIDRWFELACAAAGRNMTDREWAAVGPRDSSPSATCPTT